MFSSAHILNLGDLSGGRTSSAPSQFADHLDYDSTRSSVGALVKSSGQAKAGKSTLNLFVLWEATKINAAELSFREGRGWQVLRNNGGDLLVGARSNCIQSSMRRLAGSTLLRGGVHLWTDGSTGNRRKQGRLSGGGVRPKAHKSWFGWISCHFVTEDPFAFRVRVLLCIRCLQAREFLYL